MLLKRIYIQNFKNLNVSELCFKNGIQIITGLNGTGKTNLLDAIYYLCLTKSYFQSIEANLVKFNSDSFFLEATWQNQNGEHTLRSAWSVQNKKQFSWNGVKYNKLLEHIGKIPVVFISPTDIDLLSGQALNRRKLLDGMIAQSEHEYLSVLITYNKLLEARNNLLRRLSNGEIISHSLINTYGEQMVKPATTIYEFRENFVEKFSESAAACYQILCNNKEHMQMYCNFKEDPKLSVNQLARVSQQELLAGRSLFGPHRDDLAIELNGRSLAKFGSQGQQKSAIMAIKMAYYQLLFNKTKQPPLLLLDDLFEKIDNQRIAALFDFLIEKGYSQIFITDTDFDRVALQLETKNLPFNAFFTNELGSIIPK